MSNYSKSTNFATKDNLTPGDPLKIVRGTEIDTEFNNIATAIATKTDNASAAIVGGTINDTTIGATTASTGAFTTLAASGNVTLSGGTANGVAYLNGSKVVTSGSALVFDGSNLGLGVTPSAWSTSYKGFQIGASSALYAHGGVTSVHIANNSYEDSGGVKYKITGAAADYQQSGGVHYWYNAPSGTAGNAITFTQAMTLDDSGNLGVGTTSIPTVGSTTVLAVGNANGGTHAIVQSGSIVYRTSASTSSVDFYTGNAVPLIFYTSGSERARIDSSGNLLCGTTSSSNTPSQGITLMQNTNVGSIGIGHANGTSSGNGYMNFAYNGSAIGSITQSGTTAVLYNTTSDQRLKENIQNADSASAIIDALQVRKFDWKSDNSHQRYGFVAQELVTVAPEAVHQPEDTNEMMAVDYSKLVPMLVKEVQSLRKRLADAGL